MIMKYLVLLACCLTPNTLVTCFKFGVPKIMRSSVSFMFSGIVEEIGTIARVNAESTIELWDGSFSEGVVIDVIGKETLKDAYIGCSISLNGVCLTVTKIDTMLPSVSNKRIHAFIYNVFIILIILCICICINIPFMIKVVIRSIQRNSSSFKFEGAYTR